jgi:sugar lactone lactonase YvrE
MLPIAASLAAFSGSANSRADTLYVSNASVISSGNTIQTFTSAGVGSVFASSGLDEPRGLAFDSAGNLYVANNYANTILKFTPAGVGSVFASTGLNEPMGLAFDSAGNLFVANAGNNTVEEFTPGGVGSLFASANLNTPTGLAFDSAGNLYVANAPAASFQQILRFTPSGYGSVFADTGLRYPLGLAFDREGNLYAANQGNNTIVRFTAGGVGSVFANTDLYAPFGLAFDSAGNLYASNVGNNAIVKFTPDGVGSFFASTPMGGEPDGDYATFIAIEPGLAIPEPSTWAIVALSAAALCGSRHLCRRSSCAWRINGLLPIATACDIGNAPGHQVRTTSQRFRSLGVSKFRSCRYSNSKILKPPSV